MGSEGPERPHALLLQVPSCLPGVGATESATALTAKNRAREDPLRSFNHERGLHQCRNLPEELFHKYITATRPAMKRLSNVQRIRPPSLRRRSLRVSFGNSHFPMMYIVYPSSVSLSALGPAGVERTGKPEYNRLVGVDVDRLTLVARLRFVRHPGPGATKSNSKASHLMSAPRASPLPQPEIPYPLSLPRPANNPPMP